MRLVRLCVVLALALAPLLNQTALAESRVATSNSSEDTDAESGDATSSNSSSGVVGHSAGGDTNASANDFEGTTATNVQDGDNELTLTQVSNVQTGSAVTGQVIGAVVAGGNLTIDATNFTSDSDVETGDATGENNAVAFVGLLVASDTSLDASDFEDVEGVNVQEGDNSADINQSVDLASGEGVAGQVIGAVVQDGTTDIASSNRSEDVDIETGDVEGSNGIAAFVGLGATTGTTALSADFESVDATNAQDGDNTLDTDQSVEAVSGDGVGGQVIGAQSSGDTTIDASNTTLDADVRTGDSDATNAAAAFTGLLVASATEISAADFEDSAGTNLQEGDNLSALVQTAEASSGDAVVGQVGGVVNRAGTTTATFLNVSEDVDAESGQATFDNVQSLFTGLEVTTGSAETGESDNTVLSILLFALS